VNVRNVHERVLDVPVSRVGALLDGLSSSDDALWPRGQWPAMRLDRPLAVGAAGGHGPIRYVVERYEPGVTVRFRFTAPPGFHGTHGFDVEPLGAGRTRLRHVLEMQTTGSARVSWPMVFRPLHDALIEDALDRAAESVGITPSRREWSWWVRRLRRPLSRPVAHPGRPAATDHL
jgi:hypothetical protein